MVTTIILEGVSPVEGSEPRYQVKSGLLSRHMLLPSLVGCVKSNNVNECVQIQPRLALVE